MGRGSERAWSFTRHGGEVRLWARAGRWSLWIDTALGRCELNGASLTDLPARREDPLAGGTRPPEAVEASPALDLERRRTHAQVLSLLRSGGASTTFLGSWSLLGILALLLFQGLAQGSFGWACSCPHWRGRGWAPACEAPRAWPSPASP
jgi:hypothetical protein